MTTISTMQEFANEYSNLIEFIFDFQNILTGASLKKIELVSIEDLLYYLQTNKKQGLTDYEKVLYNQQYFGGKNKTIEQNFFCFSQFLKNYFHSQFFLWITLLTLMFQLSSNNGNQSIEENQSYKYSLIFLITIAIYNLIIEFSIIHNKNNYLQGKNRKVVQVMRDEKQYILDDELVVGDILFFQTGDIFPVDGIILEGTTVMVDESFLTQKNDPLYKLTIDEISRSQIKNYYYCNPFLLSGTQCVNGSGSMLVMAVGKNKLSSKLQLDSQQNIRLTSNSSQINGKIYWLNFIIITIILFIILFRFYYKVFNQKSDTSTISIAEKLLLYEIPKEILYFISIFFFTIPTSLPLQIILLIQQLSKDCQFQQINIQDIKSIEQLAQIKQIMIQDLNQIQNHQFLNLQQIYLGLNKFFVDANFQIKSQLSQDVIEVLTKCICNNALISPQKDKHTNYWKHSGDKIECALIDFSSELGKYYDSGIFDEQIVFQKFYNQKRQCMSSIYLSKKTNNLRMYIKGEANEILDLCKYYISPLGKLKQLTQEDQNKIQVEISRLENQSLISIALAYKDITEVPIILAEAEQEESDLTFICILQFENTLNSQDWLEQLKYLEEKHISLVLANQIHFGQAENFKQFINRFSTNQELILNENAIQNQQNINKVTINNASLQQIVGAIQNSERISNILMELVIATLQNNSTLLILILAHFLYFGNNPFIIQQIIYFSLMFELIILRIKSKYYCFRNENQQNGDSQQDILKLQNQNTITGVLCTILIQLLIYLFIQLTLPYYLNFHFPNIDKKKFQLTIFVHLIMFIQIIQMIIKRGQQNKLMILHYIFLLVANSFILLKYSDFFHLYQINYLEIKGLIIVLVLLVIIIKLIFEWMLKERININQELDSFITKKFNQRIQYLHSYGEQQSQEELNNVINRRNEIIKIIQKIDLQKEKEKLEEQLIKIRDEQRQRIKEEEERKRKEEEERQRKEEEERKRKEEEERKKKEEEQRKRKEEEERKRKEEEERKRKEEKERKRKEEEERKRKAEEERKRKEEEERKRKEEEERKRKERIEIEIQQKIERQKESERLKEEELQLQQKIRKIELDQNISYNSKRYQYAKNSQKLIKVLLDSNQAVKIEKPTFTDLEIKDNNQKQGANVNLNVNLALFVLKESFSETVEVVKTNQCIGGLDSLITGQNRDQSCFRFNICKDEYKRLSRRPNFNREMYLKDFKQKISTNFVVDIGRVEILEGFEENSYSIDFKIEGKENIKPEEQQFLQKTFNGTLEHYKYFQQAIDIKNKNLQPNERKYIGLSAYDFDPNYNMNWKNFQESCQRGPKNQQYKYYFPRTCVGYGLQVTNKYENDNWLKMDGNSGEWRILFHGTKQEFVVDIANNGLKAGFGQFYQDDKCQLTGKKVGIGIYFSDKIDYCRNYTKPVKVDKKYIRVYFMSRVRPSAIRQSERMRKINYFVVNDSKDIRPYRILLEETLEDT